MINYFVLKTLITNLLAPKFSHLGEKSLPGIKKNQKSFTETYATQRYAFNEWKQNKRRSSTSFFSFKSM